MPLCEYAVQVFNNDGLWDYVGIGPCILKHCPLHLREVDVFLQVSVVLLNVSENTVSCRV